MSETHESKGLSLVSRRWKIDVKETVNNYNFKLHHVHGNKGKCEFCGNNLVYVAVIEGDSLVEANTMDKCTKKVYDVVLIVYNSFLVKSGYIFVKRNEKLLS